MERTVEKGHQQSQFTHKVHPQTAAPRPGRGQTAPWVRQAKERQADDRDAGIGLTIALSSSCVMCLMDMFLSFMPIHRNWIVDRIGKVNASMSLGRFVWGAACGAVGIVLGAVAERKFGLLSIAAAFRRGCDQQVEPPVQDDDQQRQQEHQDSMDQKAAVDDHRASSQVPPAALRAAYAEAKDSGAEATDDLTTTSLLFVANKAAAFLASAAGRDHSVPDIELPDGARIQVTVRVYGPREKFPSDADRGRKQAGMLADVAGAVFGKSSAITQGVQALESLATGNPMGLFKMVVALALQYLDPKKPCAWYLESFRTVITTTYVAPAPHRAAATTS